MVNFVTKEEKSFLIAKFKIEPYPSEECKENYAKELEWTKDRISGWFKRKRKEKGIKPKTVRMTEEEQAILLQKFESTQYPTGEEIGQLADELDYSERKIWVWFFSERQKRGIRDVSKKADPLKLNVIKFLQEKFENDKYPSKESIKNWAAKFGATPNQLNKWFGRERKKKEIKYEKNIPITTKTKEFLSIKFQIASYPSKQQIEEWAKEIGETDYRVDHWFRRERKKKGLQDPARKRQKPARPLSSEENKFMTEQFQINAYPTRETMTVWADKFSLTVNRITRWFDRKRKKEGVREKMTYLTKEQKEFLENEFDQEIYPSTDKFETWSEKLNLPIKRLRQWFETKRKKEDVQDGKYLKPTPLNMEEKKFLLEKFSLNPYPAKEDVETWAQHLGYRTKRILTWFEKERRTQNLCDPRFMDKPGLGAKCLEYLNTEHADKYWLSAYETARLCRVYNEKENKLRRFFWTKRKKDGITMKPGRKTNSTANDFRLSKEKEEYIYDEFSSILKYDQSTYDRIAEKLDCDPFYIEYRFNCHDSQRSEKTEATVEIYKMYR